MNARRNLVIGGAGVLTAATLAALFTPLGKSGPAAEADEVQFAIARELFAEAFARPQRTYEGFSAVNLQPRKIEDVAGTTLLAERGDACAGRGAYWMRDNGGAPLVLAAPHRGADRKTGTLAAILFARSDAVAAAWNSAPRYSASDCSNGIDLVQEPLHLFTAFSLGFAASYPNGRIVQLHGFDGDRRATLKAQEASVIISNGTAEPSDQLLDLADCLTLGLAPHRVLVYPAETRELGALGNAQGQALREEGFAGFVHLEMSLPLREALIGDERLRTKLAECLAGGIA